MSPLSPIISGLILVVLLVLQFVYWMIIASVIVSWLRAFGVLNVRNAFVYNVCTMLDRMTEPMLRPIRRVLPQMGGLDFSPFVLILLLIFLQHVIAGYGAAY